VQLLVGGVQRKSAIEYDLSYLCRIWTRGFYLCMTWDRWEAHVWVKELGRQAYLGGYEQEEHAVEAYIGYIPYRRYFTFSSNYFQ
jgi:hypothetical protein